MNRRLTMLGAVLGAVVCFGAAAQTPERPPSRIEVLPISSTTLTGEEFLRGSSGREALLGGELRLPPSATGRVPAVILVHGSGGISGSADLWARELNSVGVAAFILDTFSGRGIVSTVEDQDQLHSLAMMVDAYRALDRLADHPRIRADRIAVMGFSKGAVASIYSASERFRRMHGNPERRFAAHIGLYTPCNVRYLADAQVTGAPMRFHHGVVDDYVSIAPCREYVARLRAAGVDATLDEYPNGQHGFDSPLSARLVPVPTAQSTRNCRLEEGEGGIIRVAGTSETFSQRGSACVAVGAHVGHDPEGEAAVKASVKRFLQEVLLR
ncbi:dienelactone hydrolase family protein [Roseomonas sp. CCTCC AB2023176]|uniref:dienelactone hydrolase family protein n=1 Tax=Roseomonas sp. CCTCC AB2023176 TaxID=3342640 RepID=UPI0035D61382